MTFSKLDWCKPIVWLILGPGLWLALMAAVHFIMLSQANATELRIGPAFPPQSVMPETAYLSGATDKIDGDHPCQIEARRVYRSLSGDKHYLVGLLPNGAPHVVVLSGDLVYDPIFHSEPVRLEDYQFMPLRVSELDGWHLATAH